MKRGEGTPTEILRARLWAKDIPFVKGKGAAEGFLTFVKGKEGTITAIEKVDLETLEISITCSPELASKLIELAVKGE